MRIAVIGAGGVGGYFGGRLAAADNEVTFVARGAQLDAIRANGIELLSALGDLRIHPARAVEFIDQVGVVDLVDCGEALGYRECRPDAASAS
jgi:2-dehydropantoate 2-reductase